MKNKDLKINFRYLGGNIACLSVDSIAGESIHNDINNEEAIIIFNSLVGEKENCQTVKTLLKENQELKEQLEEYIKSNMKLKEELSNKRKEYQDTYKDVRIEIKEYKTQQKEFILYLRHLSNWYSADGVKQGMVNEILQKYKEIIGGKSE